MQAIRTDESNFTYLGPRPDVADLPGQREDGCFFAVFEFTDEERRLIAAGGQLRLGVWCEPIPPVSVTVVEAQQVAGVDGEPDFRCEDCGGLYVGRRAAELDFTCGWCEGGPALRKVEV